MISKPITIAVDNNSYSNNSNNKDHNTVGYTAVAGTGIAVLWQVRVEVDKLAMGAVGVGALGLPV